MPLPTPLVSNPPWVSKIIAASYETLEDTIPAKWLPRLTDLGTAGGARVEADVKEYGCGQYGCVIPTVDKHVVLKLTTDSTEAEFASAYANQLVAPICVKYHMVFKTDSKQRGDIVYLLWRDSAEEVGNMEAILGQGAVAYVIRQHMAAVQAFKAVTEHGDKLKTVLKFAAKWAEKCQAMANQTQFPALQELGAGLLKVWREQRILFGDIHHGNLGMVNGRWVITDPGNIAIVDSEVGELPSLDEVPDYDVILRVDPTGRPSQRLFKVSGVHAAMTGEVVSRDEAIALLRDAMPPGFNYGTSIEERRGFAVVRGVPAHDQSNIVFITTPFDLAHAAPIKGPGAYAPYMEAVEKGWEEGATQPPVVTHITPGGTIYIMDGVEALELAARSNRPIAVVVREFDPTTEIPAHFSDISERILSALPNAVWAATVRSR